jgi:hypothetical protein
LALVGKCCFSDMAVFVLLGCGIAAGRRRGTFRPGGINLSDATASLNWPPRRCSPTETLLKALVSPSILVSILERNPEAKIVQAALFRYGSAAEWHP